jgi:hypothetical protein
MPSLHIPVNNTASPKVCQNLKKYRFPDNLPRSQALSAHQLSRIKWRGIARTSFSYSSSLFRQTPQLIRQDI